MTIFRCPWRGACAPSIFAALLAAVALPMPATAQPAACAAEEQTLFACRSGPKTIAVCASRPLTEAAGVVQYRFGRPGAPELAYPTTGADWRPLTRSGELMFSGGGGAFLAFTNEPYRYIVYTASGQGWGRKAGVVVEKAGKRVAHRRCTGQVTSALGPDLFSNAGIASADGSFDLP